MPNMQGSSRSFSMWFEHAGVSVQWARGNYGTNYGREQEYESPFAWEAEVAIRTSDEKGTFLTQMWDPNAFGGVLGYCTPEKVLSALNWAAAYHPGADTGLAPTLANPGPSRKEGRADG